MNELFLKIISNITSILPSMGWLIDYKITRFIQKKEIKTNVMTMLQEIQYSANVYYAAFYTLENNEKPFEMLMKKIKFAFMFIDTSSDSLNKYTRKKTQDYLIATHDNLLFSIDRLKGHLKHGEWHILPDVEQRSGGVFVLYQKARKALRWCV